MPLSLTLKAATISVREGFPRKARRCLSPAIPFSMKERPQRAIHRERTCRNRQCTTNLTKGWRANFRQTGIGDSTKNRHMAAAGDWITFAGGDIGEPDGRGDLHEHDSRGSNSILRSFAASDFTGGF